jgi:hypothetical protein
MPSDRSPEPLSEEMTSSLHDAASALVAQVARVRCDSSAPFNPLGILRAFAREIQADAEKERQRLADLYDATSENLYAEHERAKALAEALDRHHDFDCAGGCSVCKLVSAYRLSQDPSVEKP